MRHRLRTYLILTAVALLALSATASASPNNSPSKAVTVQLGKPFAGVWPGTVYQHGNSFNHWWRLPAVMRPGDTVQFAIDNRLSSRTLHFCLIAPVDDFGADAALERCGSEPAISPGQQSRATLTYEGSAGQPYLVAWISLGCCEYTRGDPDEDPDGQYSVTIEQIAQLVNIGMAVPPALPASFALGASVVYGDGTPVADGVPGVLQWRPVAPRGSDPLPFANLATGTSVAGGITFAGTFPPEAQGQKVQLRACVTQPGGPEVRCGTGARTLVAESACSRALDNQLVLSRVVHRLTKNVRRLRAGPAKLRLKRKLKAKRRKLAQANRNVKLHCG